MHRRPLLHFRCGCQRRRASKARGRYCCRGFRRRPLNPSPKFQQLAPQRIVLRRVPLIEFTEFPPNLPLSPEEDEAKKYEYELH
jgi:hypothetical protein